MTSRERRTLLLAPAAVALAGCSTLAGFGNLVRPVGLMPDQMPPPAPRELRGAWVASVANIDWPSAKGLDVERQRAEMNALLDTSEKTGLNALMLQVRPSADAIYPSQLEPWTEYLSGTQGQAPGWDPLAEWTAGAHRRGIDLHAWFNPFRARAAPATSATARSHLSLARPDWVKSYGNLQWIDPGEPDAAAHTLAVFADVQRRYDVDGLHIDDYFYPYPVKGPDGQNIDFPDEGAWQRYGAGLSRADWRRRNVDALVAALHAQSQRLRPGVAFTVSPFGLPKPDRRPGNISGFSQYDELYADVERWMDEGWLDALVPQLYWPIAQTAQAFDVLLDLWLAKNPHRRHVWAGLYTSRLPRRDGEAGWAPAEILAQIDIVRQRGASDPRCSGHVHFSIAALGGNRAAIADQLRAGPYAQPALPPATPWLDARVPAAPALQARRDPRGELQLELRAGDARATRHVLWHRPRGGAWRMQVLPASRPTLTLPAATEALVASSVSRNGIESERLAHALEQPA